MDQDTRTWRYRSNDNIIKIIEDNHIASNLEENDPFILIFPKKIEEGNNNSDINIDNSFIRISATSPLPLKYRKYADIFSKSKIRQLPDHALIKYTINTGDAESLYRPIHNLLVNELSTLRDNLKEFLEKGYIQRLISPAGAPILFIFKKDGDLRMCVDYRGLNKIIKKNRYPLPLIRETLDRLQETVVFMKLNIRDIYHRIKIKKKDE